MSNNLSDDTAHKTKELTEKGVRQLGKLLRFLIQRYSATNRLNKERLSQEKIEKKLKKKSGYIALKQLQKSKEKLRPLTIPLSEEQLKRFNYFAKKYGVIFSSVSNQTQTGVKNHHIIIREKDLALIKDITDRMNEEIKLKDYDNRIEELEKKENRTPEEDAELKNLYKEKEEIIRNGTKEFNNENAEILFNEVCGEMQSKSMNFDKILNRFTDRDFSKDQAYYVCERTNPNSYIELVSTISEFNNEEYTRTDYKVFNDGEEKFPEPFERADGQVPIKFTDERFEGRPVGYWQKLKTEMKEKGGFSDDMIIFNTKEELERYQQLYIKSVAEQSVSVEREVHNEDGYRDFIGIQEQLSGQLKARNAEINEFGKVVDGDSKEVLILQTARSLEEKLRISEAITIAKQIANYEKLNELQTRLAMDKQQLEITKKTIENLGEKDVKRGMYVKMKSELEAKVEQGESGLGKALDIENKLKIERNKLLGEKAVEDVEKEYETKQVSKENNEKSDDKKLEEKEEVEIRETQTMEDWKREVSEERESMQNTEITQGKNIDKTVEKTVSVSTKDDR